MFTKARQSLLVESVVDQIEAAIVQGRLKPGERLPGTEDLQEAFGASRGTLREAFRVLRQKGLLRAKSGAGGGVFIQSLTMDPVREGLGLLIRTGQIDLKHLAEFREGLEGSVAELAAQRPHDAGLQELEGLKKKLDSLAAQGPQAWDGFHAVEAAMHKNLVRSTGNPLFELNMVTVHENIGTYYRNYLPKTAEILERNCRDWDNLLAAIKAGRAEEAGRIMREHIHWSNQEMMNSRADSSRGKTRHE